MLHIPGTASVKHLEDDVQGATMGLTDEEYDTISRNSSSGDGRSRHDA